MTPAELRQWVIKMLRAGAGDHFEVETVEPKMATRQQKRTSRKSVRRRTIAANRPHAGDEDHPGRSS